MVQVNNYSKAFVELNEIIKYFDDNLKNKIPNDLKDAISKSSKNEYKFVYDKNKPLYKQNILPETKALLSILYSDYLCPEKEREKWIEYDKFEQKVSYQKQEEEKAKKYNPNEIFKNNSNKKYDKNLENTDNTNKNMEMIKYKKQKWYQKLFAKILKMF